MNGVMLKKHIIFTIMLLLVVSNTSAKKIRIGVSFSIPPYVIKESNSGLELELLSEAFKVKGHTVEIWYLPLARTFDELQRGELDGIINVNEGILDDVYYSDIVINFQNCAISLTKNHLVINSIEDLKNKKVVAFQRASTILGDEFNQMAKVNKNYQEVARQLNQVNMLFRSHLEVAVMDKNIFEYYRKQAQVMNKLSSRELQQDVTYHAIFPKTQYRFAFIDKDIRDDFNEGLMKIHNNGTYSHIMRKYKDLVEINLN